MKKNFSIFLCQNCGAKLYSPSTQKTKTCLSCRKKINIERAKKIGFFETEQDAILALKYYKVPKNLRDEILDEIMDKSNEKTIKTSIIQQFKNLLNELSIQDANRLINIQDLYEKAKFSGIKIETVKKLIDELISNGTLYEPKIGFFHFT